MIRTISDLDSATDAEIERARKSVNLKGILNAQMKEDGKEQGQTLEEWKAARAARTPVECGACEGKGKIMPRVRTVGTIHASSASACVVALYYDVTGEFAPEGYISPELRFTFDIGHAIHASAQAALHRALGENFEDEVSVNVPEALIVNGSADGVAQLDLCDVLLEIKTISEKDFVKLRSPKKDHIVQAAGLYAKGLDVPFISYLYISKGWPHNVKEYVIVYDEKVFNKWYLEKGSKVEQALEDGKPPKADATSPYQCKDCKYRNNCSQALGMRDRFTKY